MRGNFVDVPTDCPQRDERLGWTGDLQVFAPTATFLYDVARVPRRLARRPPCRTRALRVPFPSSCPRRCSGRSPGLPGRGLGRCGDRRALGAPRALRRHRRSSPASSTACAAGSTSCGRRRATGTCGPRSSSSGTGSTRARRPISRGGRRPTPSSSRTAYFARSAQIVADAAAVLGHDDLAEEYGNLAATVRAAFRDMYVAPSGRISSDSPTAYAIAIAFDLYERPEQRAHAAARLALVFEAGEHRIATGFVGTPLVLPALSAMGDTRTAYRLLTETACPSWLYPVTMGATTVWERWDSMLPDGSINPGEMTSFNHYALGSVADWMHQVIGGIAPAAAGYRELRFAPVPGRGVTSAECALRTPYGTARCRWSIDGTRFSFEALVPPNTTATAVLPGGERAPDRRGRKPPLGLRGGSRGRGRLGGRGVAAPPSEPDGDRGHHPPDRASVVPHRRGPADRLRRVRRAHGPVRLRGRVRPRQPARRRARVPPRRARRARAPPAHRHAVPGRQLRLGLPLAGRHRAPGGSTDGAGARLAEHRAQRVRHRRVPRPVPPHALGSDAGRQPRDGHAGGGARLGRVLQRPARLAGGGPAGRERSRRALRREVVVPGQRDGRRVAARPRACPRLRGARRSRPRS